jgi:glycosyltransferase involved in cell wall biosynthesis
VGKIVIHFARLGPYHLARLKSAGEVLGPTGWRVVALETAGGDATYAWERMESVGQDFERRTVFDDRVYEEISASEAKRGIFQELDKIQPQAVAIAGWGTADARACLAWCNKNGAKAIVMSETRAADGRRVWWKEWIKSRLVRKFDGALCGGESHKRYLMALGIPAERIEFGYNVVDNCFFGQIRNGECSEQGGEAGLTTIERGRRCEKEQPKVGPKGEGVGTTESKSTELEAGARLSCQAGDEFSIPLTSELARDSETPSCTRFADASAFLRANSDSLPATELQVPAGPFFLASNRFVERKNLGRLIQAYAKYAESFHQGGVENIWPLVLLGDGELRGELEALCGELGLIIAGGHSHGGAERAEGEHLKLNSYKLKTPTVGGLVVFAGFRQIEELPAFYAGAGAFVHSALEEPWGLVINEAMASGLPVLSSRNVGAAEELVVDGKTGYLFDPRNIEEMANAMSKVTGMTQEEQLTMGRAAFEMVERKAPAKAFGEGLAKLLIGKL